MANLTSTKYVTKSIDVTTISPSSPQDLYICPSNFVCLVKFLHLSNSSSNNKKISVYWYEASTATHHYIVDNFAADANSMHEVIEGGSYIALQQGDKLQCFAETAGTYHVTMSGEEYYQPTQ
jgi:hypothetical protein